MLYLVRLTATHPDFAPIEIDQFVGGYPNQLMTNSKVELGTIIFSKAGSSHDTTIQGRIYDAFTNETFTEEYLVTLYEGYGTVTPQELGGVQAMRRIEFKPEESYTESYTGYFELPSMKAGAYYSVYQAPGYISNYQRINVLKASSPMFQSSDPVPMIPVLDEHQLALSLTWGNRFYDLDLVVEFVASSDLTCRVNFSNRECGGVRLVVDNSMESQRSSADVI